MDGHVKGARRPQHYCQLGRIGRTARLCCGTEQSIHYPVPAVAAGLDPLVSQLKAEVEEKRVATADPLASAMKKIKLATTLDQGNDGEID
eukprot:1487284-Amphidinium_carterae.1